MKKRLNISNRSGFTEREESSGFNDLTGIPYSQRYYELLKFRKQLPAWEAREQFLKLIRKHQIVVLEGETGSGKTTQIPQFLVEEGFASQE
jgi:pre-mRNA-splicing factor ATP-dependent RNA helicase DHX15/PRP43